MALTQEQQNYLNSGGTLTNGQIPSTYAPTGQETLNSTNLAPSQPLNLPQAPQDTTNYAGVITSIPTFDQVLAQAGQASPAEQTSQGLMSKILSSMQKLGGKGEAQLKAEQNAGLPGFQTQLTDINSQLQGLQKEALAIPLQIQEQATGRGVTAGGVAPIQNAQLRQNAIKSLTLSAIGQTLQGNIANAQAQADRVVQLEFAPIEAELNTLKTAYELNKDVLERQDKRKADMLNLTLQERSRALEQQKEDKKTVLGFIAEASKNGAPTALVQRVSEINDPSQALTMLSQYMVDPQAKANALMQRKLQQAQIDKIYGDLALSKEELALKRSQQAGTTVVDPVTGKPTSELKLNARDSAKSLLDKFNKGVGTSGIGKGGAIARFTTGLIGGTGVQDFQVQFDNLKSLLSLENIKLLKGQGAVSDAERQLLADASTKLSMKQSEPEFKRTLIETNIGFGNPQEVTLTDANGNSQKVLIDADGLNKAKADGLTITY